MKNKTYKALWLDEELANEIKILAAKEGKTIINFIRGLLTEKK